MWFTKNKWKIVVPVLLVVILAVSFWYGGGAPGTRGWSLSESTPTSLPVPVTGTKKPDNTAVSQEDPETDSQGTVSLSAGIDAGGLEETEPAPTESPVPSATPATQTSAPPETVSPPSEQPQETSAIMEAAPSPTMIIDEATGQDEYQTDPVPEGKPLPVEWQDAVIGTGAYTCTISIYCATILDNMDWLDSEKHELVPEDGWILEPITVTVYEGESVFNVLQRTCKQQKIQMEFENTPIYNSAYIEGISNLYEFNVGELSGWMYRVNDWFPNYGCSRYQVKNGDVIEWIFTCDLGFDIGGGYAVGNGI